MTLTITVEPRSNGPASNGIPPITEAYSLSLQSVFFYFLTWLKQNSAHDRRNLLVPEICGSGI